MLSFYFFMAKIKVIHEYSVTSRFTLGTGYFSYSPCPQRYERTFSKNAFHRGQTFLDKSMGKDCSIEGDNDQIFKKVKGKEYWHTES